MQIKYITFVSLLSVASALTTTVTPAAKATITTTLSASSTSIFGCMSFGGPSTCCDGAVVNGTVSVSQVPDEDDEPATTTTSSAPYVMVSVEAEHCVGTVYVYQTAPASTTASATSSRTSNAAVPTVAVGRKWEMLGMAAVAVVGVVV